MAPHLVATSCCTQHPYPSIPICPLRLPSAHQLISPPAFPPLPCSKLAKAVGDAAKSYTAVEPPNFHFEVPNTLATADYHQVLEDSAVAQLKGWLGMTLQQPLNAQLESFTTTDVEGALQVGRLHT